MNEPNELKEYSVPVSWVMTTRVTVKAKSPEDAIKLAKNSLYGTNVPLPKVNTYYLDESFHVDDEDIPDEIPLTDQVSPYSISEVRIDEKGVVTVGDKEIKPNTN